MFKRSLSNIRHEIQLDVIGKYMTLSIYILDVYSSICFGYHILWFTNISFYTLDAP